MPFVPGDGGSFRPARARESYAGGLRDEGASNYFQRVRTAELDAHASVLAATKQDPDSAAKARRLASYTGIPVDTVMRNLPDLEATLRGEAASDAMRKDPAILRWMADPWRAASSHDDLPAMGEASRALAEAKPSSLFDVRTADERLTRAQKAYNAAVRLSPNPQQDPSVQAAYREAGLAADSKRRVSRAYDAENAGGLWDRMGTYFGQGVDSLFAGFQEVADGFTGGPTPMQGASAAQRSEYSLNKQAFLNPRTVRGSTSWEDVKARPLSGNAFSFIAETGAQSLPGMGTAMVSAPIFAVSLTGQVGNRRAQNNGREHATAGDLLAAAPSAVASAWLEKIGAMSIFRPVGATALKKIGYGALAETATEAVQSSVEYAGGSVGTDRGFSTLEMLDQAAAGALAGAGMGGIFTSAHVVPRKAIESAVRVMQARTGRRIVDQVFTAAANSETRRRDPALFAEFLAQAANGTAVENLLIPAKKIRELYQSSGRDWNADEDPLFGSFTPDFREQMEAGLASGGDVVVPLAQAAAHLAGTPEWDALKGDVRSSPKARQLSGGAFSDSEAAAMEAEWAAHMEDLGQRAAKEARDEADAAAPREKVFSAVLSFARQSGFSLGASRAYADLWAERYQARAERLGGDANAFDLFQSSLAGIQQDLPGSVKGYRKGDGLDVLINAMRNSAQPMAPQGKTLIDRIIEGGGIIDTGGDVAKMGGDKVAKGDGLFGRRKQPLIRQRDDTGETLGMGSNADYGADEWALRLWEEGYFPDLQDRPDVNTLLDAIGEGLSGNHSYAAGAVTAAVETNNSIVQAADDLRNVLFNAGLDPETASREEIEKAIRDYQNEDGRGFEQSALPETIEIDGVMRSTRNSEGRALARDEAGVRAFWNWFGESKVVDDQGRPLVVYHGTKAAPDENFAFDRRANVTASDFYFTADRSIAEVYGRLQPVYLSAPKLLDIRAEDIGSNGYAALRKVFKEGDFDAGGEVSFDEFVDRVTGGQMYDAGPSFQNEVLGWLADENDGVLMTDAGFGGAMSESYVVFVPEQIKSVDNVGLFDPADPRILFQSQDQGGARGRIDFLADNRAMITLFEGRDMSTLLHEGGHLWLEELRADALASLDAKPVTLFHGSPRADLTVADIQIVGGPKRKQGKAGSSYGGFYASDVNSTSDAEGYAGEGGTVYRIELRPGATIETKEGDITRLSEETIADYRARGVDVVKGTDPRGRTEYAIINEGAIASMVDRNTPPEKRGSKVFSDWETVKAWFKREGIEVDDQGDIPTEAHELWARGMERYFMEGKAPSRVLEGAFGKFRAWLLRIYQLVERLGSNIDNDVRRVFDRMIATDNAIAWAAHEADERALFETAEAAGMSRQEFAAYRGLLTESRTEAYDALLYRTMERLRREKTVAYKEERDRVRLQMAEEVGQRPEFVALDLIRGKGEEWLPLDREGVVERVGRDALEALPRGRPGKPTIKPGGASPDLVAERAGFADGKALLEALLGIQRRHLELVAANDGRSVLEEAIDVATEAEMTERHADAFDDGSLEEEALELIHTDASADRLAAEVRQLARKSGDVPPPVDVVKRWAERIVREGRVQDHASAAALERHRRAESRAARAAEQAYMGGDFQTAFVEKQRQMFAAALYRASRDAKNKVDVIARRLDRLARAKTLKGMDQDYLDQIHGLLEQYDLRKRSAADIRERESFDKWAKAREEEGVEVFIPERLTLAGNLNFTKLTFEDLSALDDAVQSLAHLGREKKRLKLAKEERDFAELVAEAQAQVAGLRMRPWSAERNPKPSKLREVDAMLTKIEFLADQLDGGNPNGVFNRVLVQQATICANEKEELVAKVLLPLAELYLNAPKAQQKRWAQRVEVPEFITINPETREVHATTFLRSELIAVALNIGNASNLEKMLVGETLALPELQRESYAWTEEKVMSVLERELTAEDWQFVEKVWRQIDMLWPDIARSEREITGIVPEKIEGRKVTTPFGDIMGGYYPVVFDPLRSQRAADNLDADAAKLLGQIGRNISTPKGHTITRTSAAMPITFSLERVLFNHINRVTTRIAYGRFVRDALKFISDPKIRKIVDEHAGLEYYKHLKPWLQRQVNEAALDTNTMAALDRILRQFRVNAQLVWMGFRITTMVSQVAGWNNSVAQIGSKYMLKGMFETARNMGEIRTWVFEQSGEMASRAQAFDRDIRAFYQDAGKAGRREGKTLLDYFARADDALGLDKVRAAAFWGIGMIDVYLVAMPTWVGAYHKGVDEGMSVDEARAYADKAVRESQGAGRAKDLSPIQDAGEATRILTLAYSYFSVQYNKQRETIHAARSGDWRRASMNVFWIMMVAPVAAAFMTGDWPDEEDRDVDGWVTWAMRKMFFGLWAGIPIVRDIASKTERAVSGKFSGEIKAPVYEAFSQIERPIGEAIRVAKGEGPSERWLQNTITPLGYFLGLPTGQVGSTAQYAYDVGTGAQNPDSFGDVVEGTVRGPQDDQR